MTITILNVCLSEPGMWDRWMRRPIICVSCLGFSTSLIRKFHERAKTLSWARRVATRPVAPALRTFKPKIPGIKRLKDYSGSFPSEFWESFPAHRPVSWDPSSWISGPVLLKEAKEANLDNLSNARRAEEILVNGADTG